VTVRAVSLTHSHVDEPRLVGQRVRAAREKLGLTLRELGTDGCTPAYICRIEKGARVPSWTVLGYLARELDTTPEWLARGDQPGLAITVAKADLDAVVVWATSGLVEEWADLPAEKREQLELLSRRGAVTALVDHLRATGAREPVAS